MIEIKHSTVMHFCVLIVRAWFVVSMKHTRFNEALALGAVGEGDFLVLFFVNFYRFEKVNVI